MVAWRFATLWLALIAPVIAAPLRAEGDHRNVYQVLADDTELMVEPNAAAYATGTLGRGDRVVVLATQPGWAQVETPPTDFHWINAAEIDQKPDGSCVVTKRRATIRYASESARLPGPPYQAIKKGTIVHLLDHPPLQVNAGGPIQVWRAIGAIGDESRYVRLESLAIVSPPPGPVRQPAEIATPAPRAERTVAYQADADEANLPPEVNAELASIAAMTRSIKASSVETWNLDPVRGRYDALLRQFGSNPAVKAAVEPRLAQVHRELELASAADKFARLLREGEQRDAGIAQIERAVTLARAHSERNYDAQGLLQPSSRLADGQKVLALIGTEGRPISYLTIAPGVPVNQFMARRVGVRGIVHFNEELGARLISVRDLELLDKSR